MRRHSHGGTWSDSGPHKRARAISGTGLPTDWRVFAALQSRDHVGMEKRVHNYASKHRQRKDREVFTLTPDQALTAVNTVFDRESDGLENCDAFKRRRLEREKEEKYQRYLAAERRYEDKQAELARQAEAEQAERIRQAEAIARQETDKQGQGVGLIAMLILAFALILAMAANQSENTMGIIKVKSDNLRTLCPGMLGWVYLIVCRETYGPRVKIGLTRYDPRGRADRLANDKTKGPDGLPAAPDTEHVVVGAFQCKNFETVEATAHQLMAEFSCGGEWFGDGVRTEREMVSRAHYAIQRAMDKHADGLRNCKYHVALEDAKTALAAAQHRTYTQDGLQDERKLIRPARFPFKDNLSTSIIVAPIFPLIIASGIPETQSIEAFIVVALSSTLAGFVYLLFFGWTKPVYKTIKPPVVQARLDDVAAAKAAIAKLKTGVNEVNEVKQ